MLILQNAAYSHPNQDLLFDNLNIAIQQQDKIALVGNNGVGKSTLLKILAGTFQPTNGQIKRTAMPYYVPQVFGQFNHLSIADALQITDKLRALKEILGGNVMDEHLSMLADDWTIDERCTAALANWNLQGLDLTQKMAALSGGEKTKVFLAGILIHQPSIVLLDEPSNHLDAHGRDILYNYIKSTQGSLVVVSHDRCLLNLVSIVYELAKSGITVYGGNYDFYTKQKMIESAALDQDVRDAEQSLRKAKEIERQALARQQKLDARGKRKQEKAGVPTIAMNTLRNNAEQSTARLKDVHAGKVAAIRQELVELRNGLPDMDRMKMGFGASNLHNGKMLVTARNVNVGYNGEGMWKNALSFEVLSGERIAIGGLNGVGKTSLLKMILGSLQPLTGTLHLASNKTIYIDQDYSLIDDSISIYEQARQYNTDGLQEHEINIRLTRFLFTKDHWNKTCGNLSGGEKMRLILCCLTMSDKAPDMMILDEPTNNLDLQNIEMLTAAINNYKGTLIIVSHDAVFLQQMRIERTINIEKLASTSHRSSPNNLQ